VDICLARRILRRGGLMLQWIGNGRRRTTG
jgi:hypothetical protein